MSTRIVISFESELQSPYFMIIKEYCDKRGAIFHAEILYMEEELNSDIAIGGDAILKHTKDGIELHGLTSLEPWI